MLGLPDTVTACLFDLDGVLTATATVHRDAWTQTFDEFLTERAERLGEEFVAFDPGPDYDNHVDGRPRADGVRTFLTSRGIELPDGSAEDAGADLGTGPDATIHGVANRKNTLLLQVIDRDGVEVYEGSRRYLAAVTEAGLRRGLVSSSANAGAILRVTGLERFIEVRVDGQTVVDEHLTGKPSPATFLAAAQRLGVPPGQTAVFEDAIAGVQAGRAGGFGHVVGVDRTGAGDTLLANGADVVVTDLAELIG